MIALRLKVVGAAAVAAVLSLLLVVAIGQHPAGAKESDSERAVSSQLDPAQPVLQPRDRIYLRNCTVPRYRWSKCGHTFEVPAAAKVRVTLAARERGGRRVDVRLKRQRLFRDTVVGRKVVMRRVGSGGFLWLNNGDRARTVYAQVASPSLKRFHVTLRIKVY